MEKFDIRDQTRLSVAKVAGLVASGIRFRLFRTAITVLIVALAVAFLMAIVTDGLLARQALRHIGAETAGRRQFQAWVHRLTAPITEETLSQTLAAMQPGEARWREVAAWTGADDAALAATSELARRERRYLRFLDRLPEGQLRALAGPLRGRAVFDHLQDAAVRQAFLDKLGSLGRVLPGRREDFVAFLESWPAARDLRRRALAADERAVSAMREALGGRTAADLLAALRAEDVAVLERAGFFMEAGDIATVRAAAAAESWAEGIERLLLQAPFRQRLIDFARLRDGALLDPLRLYQVVARPRGAAWLTTTAKELGLALEIDADTVRTVAAAQLRLRRLMRAESMLSSAASSGEGPLGLSAQMLWLIAVSLLVCVVGIANAMLMSVAERFREIATMKCLGATDGFIMLNFLMESGVQGLVGGVLGAVAGFGFGSIRTLGMAGAVALQAPPWGALLAGGGLAIGLGMLLSVLAATYPAWAAARLAPMEAMRVE